jgi:hypothetical protein
MHGNATAAFIGAHPRAANWKRRSAGRKAVELMKRPAVQARVDVFQTAMLEQSNASLIAHLGSISPDRGRIGDDRAHVSNHLS